MYIRRGGSLPKPRWATGTTARKGPGGYGGSFGFGFGGSTSADAFGKKPAPTPARLVDCYKQIIYSCITLNQGAVSSNPLRLYAYLDKSDKKKAWDGRPIERKHRLRTNEALKSMGSRYISDEVEEVTSHVALDVISRPNKYFDGNSLLQYIVVSMDVVGAFYAEPLGSRLGNPVKELWPLPPHYVFPVPEVADFAEIDYYLFGSLRFEFEELIRIQWNDLRNPYLNNYSPTRAAFQYAGLEDEWVSTQRQTFENGPGPSAVFSPKDPEFTFSPETRVRLETALNIKHTAGGRGRALVTDGALDMHPITYPPNEVAETGVAEYDLERICNCFGVHPAQMSRDTNMANMQAANEHHAKRAVLPRCIAIANGLTREVAQRYDKRLFFAFDPVVTPDLKLQAEIHDKYISNGVYTINRVRADLGEQPSDYGELPWFSNKLIQPDAMAEQMDHEQEMDRAQLRESRAARLAQQAAATAAATAAANKPKKPAGKSFPDHLVETVGRLDERLRVIANKLLASEGTDNGFGLSDALTLAAYLRNLDRRVDDSSLDTVPVQIPEAITLNCGAINEPPEEPLPAPVVAPDETPSESVAIEQADEEFDWTHDGFLARRVAEEADISKAVEVETEAFDIENPVHVFGYSTDPETPAAEESNESETIQSLIQTAAEETPPSEPEKAVAPKKRKRRKKAKEEAEIAP